MLASITPLGERGRGSHWGVTVSAFGIGATLGGVVAGAIAGLIGEILIPAGLGAGIRLAILALAGLGAIVLDSRRDAVPGPRRQVDERWLDQFRGWVYGLGFGAQLGTGVATVVSSASTYLALLASLLVAAPVPGAVVMGVYGLIRGLSPLVTARVAGPRQLVALHSWLDRARVPVRHGGLVLMAGIVAASIGWAIG